MAHADIQIPFTLYSRNFEALGFLNDGEDIISGAEILARTTGVNGGMIESFGDVAFVAEYRHHLPAILQSYDLLTNGREVPRRPYNAMYFVWFANSGWLMRRNRFASNWWGANNLVLRRLP